MGSNQSTPSANGEGGSKGCPMHRKPEADSGKEVGASVPAESKQGSCPVNHKAGSDRGGCPVKNKDGSYKSADVFNVYSQKIDPSNNMPVNPNQSPWPGQKKDVSVDRVVSTIPKGGTDGTWLFPSPQMFFNALKRKDKGDNTDEDDMDMVVAIHNNMNERTWDQVMDWESLHRSECDNPMLLRFIGRPDELSPLARVRSWLGMGEPFDRHDWTIDRCGRQVRYIIDYYHDEDKSHLDQKPELHSIDSVKSISMTVRPALDSVDAVVDRLRFPIYETMGWLPGPVEEEPEEVAQEAAPSTPAPAPAPAAPATPAAAAAVESSVEAPVLPKGSHHAAMEEVFGRCADRMAAMQQCEGEEECGRAQVALNMCLGSVVCREQHSLFQTALAKQTGAEGKKAAGSDEVEGAYEKMQKCLELWAASQQ